MGYSTNKPYQRSTYRAPTDGSYDRYLKSGTLVGNKESVLEKPYKTSTYAQMQQDFNIPLPPPFDWGDLPVIPGMDLPPPPGDVIPIGGTGALTCYWTSTGCEQLVGCWAGSDLVLDGPEAATAGYLPPQVSEGEIVQTTISGSENRGIDFVLNPAVPRNIFTVSFKDANGVIASQTIDITCTTASYTIERYGYLGTAYYNLTTEAIDRVTSQGAEDPNIGLDSYTDIYDNHHNEWIWFVPETIDIFQGGSIESASLKLLYKGAQTGYIETANIYVYNYEDASTLPDALSAGLFPSWFYGTSVSWTMSTFEQAISDGGFVVSADISALVEFIVAQAWWTPGDSMGFLIIPTAGTSGTANAVYPYLEAYNCSISITSADVSV